MSAVLAVKIEQENAIKKQIILDILRLFEYTCDMPLYGQDIRDSIKRYAKENEIKL